MSQIQLILQQNPPLKQLIIDQQDLLDGINSDKPDNIKSLLIDSLTLRYGISGLTRK